MASTHVSSATSSKSSLPLPLQDKDETTTNNPQDPIDLVPSTFSPLSKPATRRSSHHGTDIEKVISNMGHPDAIVSKEDAYTGWRWFAVCIAIYSSAFLYGLDNTIVADVQAPVIETFGAVQKLAWLGIGFPLGSIATILSLGKAYGIFDVKYLYIASLVMFAAGSALCGGAPNMDALIVGRVWAGAGGAGMYLGVLNLISINTTIQQRSIYMGLTAAVWSIGCILGPIIGGSFADSGATWRWAFYLNLVIFAVCSPVYIFLLRSFQPQPDVPFGRKLKELDWVGVVLNAGLYTSFVMLFTFAGAEWAWDDGRTITLFVVFGVIVLGFAVQQSWPFFTTTGRRLFPVDFLRHRTLILLYIQTACAATALFVPIYYIPLYFQFSKGDSGIQAAVRLLPFVCLNIFSALLNGTLLPKYGYYMPWYVVSGTFMLIGGALMYALVDVTTGTSQIYGYSVLIAIGAGLTEQAAYSVAPAKVKPERIADAIGFINAAQIGAIVIALTITGTIFQNIGYQHVSNALAGQGFSTQDIRAALAGAQSAVFETASPEVREKVVEGIVKAIGDGYILVIVAGALSLVCSLLMKREKLFLEMTAGG